MFCLHRQKVEAYDEQQIMSFCSSYISASSAVVTAWAWDRSQPICLRRVGMALSQAAVSSQQSERQHQVSKEGWIRKGTLRNESSIKTPKLAGYVMLFGCHWHHGGQRVARYDYHLPVHAPTFIRQKGNQINSNLSPAMHHLSPRCPPNHP